ncbi:MAG: alpha-glucosidase, partial [Spirochaetales bacterium]
KKELSGGLLVEETCHWFDLARYLMGREVESLSCVTRDCFYPDFDFEDIAYVQGTFQEGGIFQISHALTGFDFSLIIQIHGTDGTLWGALKEVPYSSLDGGETSWCGLLAEGPLNGTPEIAQVEKFGIEATEPENIREAVVEFTRVVAQGGKPFASLEDGYRSLELSLLAGEASKKGQVLPYYSQWPPTQSTGFHAQAKTSLEARTGKLQAVDLQNLTELPPLTVPGTVLSPIEYGASQKEGPVSAKSLSGQIEARTSRTYGELKGLTVDSSAGEIRLYFRNRLLFYHSKDQPGLSYGYGEGLFQVNRGNFRISEMNRKIFLAQDAWVSHATPTGVEIRFRKPHTVSLQFVWEEGKVCVYPSGFPEGTNRFLLSYPLLPEESIYGCGEQFSYFNLRGRLVPLWSEEQGVGRSIWDPLTHYMNWKHGAGGHWYSTYFPQPTFVTAVPSQATSVATLPLAARAAFFHADTRAYARFDFRLKQQAVLEFWEVPTRMYMGVEPTLAQTLDRLSALLGRMSPLPEWTYKGIWLGVQGGKSIVEEKLRAALQAGVPVGALWAQDWEGRRITSFGKQLFWNWEYHREMYPDLPHYIRNLRERDIRFLGYINTFLALEGSLYKEAAAKNYCVKDSKGKDYYVYITTFPAALVDLTNPEARTWIKEVIKTQMIGIGLSGWMADFGEYLPTDAVLASGEPATLLHNPWPALWAQVNREAVEEAGVLEDTVFFLRAGYTGTSRFGRAVWAGDQLVNFSLHDGLASVIPAALSLGMCGTAIHHSDIGGYTTLAWVKRTPEVFQRWAELAAFTPIMRTHEGNRPDSNHQFYSHPSTLAHLARMVRVFCGLKPYHLALQHEHLATGLPLFRPLFLHYPEDPTAYKVQYQYLYGKDLLVAPVIRKGATRWKVYLPEDTWVHLWGKKSFGSQTSFKVAKTSSRRAGNWIEIEAPLGYPPVFYRKGSPFEGLFEEVGKY